MTDSTTLLEISDLGRRFASNWALSHVGGSVDAGEILLLAGANGSGKTTLLRLVAGLDRPSSGSMKLFGVDPAIERHSCRLRLSFIAGHAFLYERLSAREHLRLWAGLAGVSVDSASEGAMLEEVGLAHAADRPTGGFSAGMRRRLSWLRLRLEKPQLVLLDEPFNALDQAGKELVSRWIGELADGGATVLLASHDIERSVEVCTSAWLIEKGQIRWKGPAAALVAAMTTLEAA